MRILIIEDSTASRILMAKMLKAVIPNIQVTETANGQNALVLISSNVKFDLIFLDLGLPDINGLQLLKIFKNLKLSCPIITLSNKSNVDILEESVQHGAIKYLTKPVHKSHLLNLLKDNIQIKAETIKNKILIVDDDESNREILKCWVNKHGYETDEASNGFESIRLTQKNYYSCILMDIRMPYMDGIEASKQIHRAFPYIPIIIVTAEHLSVVAENCYNTGVNLVLSKPFKKETLLSSIDQLIKNSQDIINKVFDKDVLFTEKSAVSENSSALHENFLKFVPNSFIPQENLNTPIEVGLHKVEQCSVLTINITEFKKLSRKMTSEQCFNFLNSYFEMLEPTVNNFGGLVYQFSGDHMVCVFPLYKNKFSNNVLQAATSIQDKITIYNKGRERAGYEPISIGCGIATGPLSIGICGSSSRHEIAIFGIALDTAKESQLKCEEFGIDITLTENTYNKLDKKEIFLIRSLGEHRLENINRKVSLYEAFSNNSPIIRQCKEDCMNYMKKSKKEGSIIPINELIIKFPNDPVLTKLKSQNF
jgi:CheY-like chemotaxis protein/class 3 adenylate cyclase